MLISHLQIVIENVCLNVFPEGPFPETSEVEVSSSSDSTQSWQNSGGWTMTGLLPGAFQGEEGSR